MADLAELNLVIRSDQVTTAEKRLDQLGKTSKTVEANTQKLADAQGGLFAKLANITQVAQGLIALLKAGLEPIISSIEEGANFEATQAGFETLLKSASEAERVLKELTQFAATTPFQFNGLTDVAKKMLAMQFSAQELIPVMKTVGDAASALNTGQEGMEQIVTVLGRIRASGKVDAREMMELVNSNINGWKYLADAIGTDVPMAMAYSEKHMITSEGAIKAILDGLAKDFSGGMERASKLTKGLWSNLVDEMTLISRELGLTFIEAFNIKGGIREAIGWIHDLGAAVIDLIRALAGLEPKWEANRSFTEGTAQVIKGIWTASIQGFFTLVEYLRKGWEYIKYGFNVAWETVSDGAVAAFDRIRKLIADIIDGVLELTGIATKIGSSVSDKVIEAIDPKFAQVVKAFSSADVSEGLSKLKDVADGLRQPLGKTTWDQYTANVEEYGRQLDMANKEIEKTSDLASNKMLELTPMNMLSQLVGMIPGLQAWRDELHKDQKAADDAAEAMQKIADMRDFLGGKSDDASKMAKAMGLSILQVAPAPDKKGILGPSPDDIRKGKEAMFDLLKGREQDLALLGVSKDEQDRITGEMKMQDIIQEHMLNVQTDSVDKEKAWIEAAKARFNQIMKDLEEAKKLRELADNIGSAFGNAFESAALEGKKFRDVMMGLIKDIEKALFQALVRKPLESFVSNGLFGILSNAFGIGGGTPVANPSPLIPGQSATTSAPVLPNFLGNVFAFASGGVVGGPTLFPMRGGRTGLMGERGPEAVMPLTRTADGRLGVASAGGSNNRPIIVNVYTQDADSFRRSKRQVASDIRAATGGR